MIMKHSCEHLYWNYSIKLRVMIKTYTYIEQNKDYFLFLVSSPEFFVQKMSGILTFYKEIGSKITRQIDFLFKNSWYYLCIYI